VVITDPLTSARVFATGACPLRLDTADFVQGGYQVTIRGKCTESSTTAFVNATSRGVTFTDGEMRVQARVVAGTERTFMALAGRVGAGRSHGYLARFDPVTPRVSLSRWDGAEEATSPAIVEVTDPARLPFVEGWNTLAMRFKGTRIWVLLNETVILSAEDSTYDAGAVEVGAGRHGDLEDDYESAVLYRNLEIRALADGDPARAPVYRAGS
jgi:hypothetical protein